MAIVQKPKRSNSDAVPQSVEKAAAAFISGADGQAELPAPAVKRQKKEPVLLRFDDETLRRIDQDARRLGLSRAAWVRMVVAQRLEE